MPVDQALSRREALEQFRKQKAAAAKKKMIGPLQPRDPNRGVFSGSASRKRSFAADRKPRIGKTVPGKTKTTKIIETATTSTQTTQTTQATQHEKRTTNDNGSNAELVASAALAAARDEAADVKAEAIEEAKAKAAAAARAAAAAVYSVVESMVAKVENEAATNSLRLDVAASEQRVLTLTNTVESLRSEMHELQYFFDEERQVLATCAEDAERQVEDARRAASDSANSEAASALALSSALERSSATSVLDEHAVCEAIDAAMEREHERLLSTEATLQVTMDGLEIEQKKSKRLESEHSATKKLSMLSEAKNQALQSEITQAKERCVWLEEKIVQLTDELQRSVDATATASLQKQVVGVLTCDSGMSTDVSGQDVDDAMCRVLKVSDDHLEEVVRLTSVVVRMEGERKAIEQELEISRSGEAHSKQQVDKYKSHSQRMENWYEEARREDNKEYEKEKATVEEERIKEREIFVRETEMLKEKCLTMKKEKMSLMSKMVELCSCLEEMQRRKEVRF